MISGKGSNLQNALEIIEDIDCQWVISSRKKAQGIRKARRFGCHVSVLPSGPFPSIWLGAAVKERGVSKVFLLGFMRILPADFLKLELAKIFNLHPSLLPLFPGKDAFERSFESQAPLGVTIHEVNERVDEGQAWVKHRILRSDATFKDMKLRLALAERSAVSGFLRKIK
jgi:phosphoribosylglycinamide formyltransferase-1